MIYIENVFYMDCQIINLVTIKKVKSQVILLYLINNKKFYNKKTQKLLKQINKLDN